MKPSPPYYVVIFSAQHTSEDEAGYGAMGARMFELVTRAPGYVGMEHVGDPSGRGITLSYWQDLESIRAWKANVEHLAAQTLGRERWYSQYRIEVCKVERAYEFSR